MLLSHVNENLFPLFLCKMEAKSRNLNKNPSEFNISGLSMFLNTDTFNPNEKQTDLDLQYHPQQEDPLLIVDSVVGDTNTIPASCKFKNTDENKSEENVCEPQNNFLQENFVASTKSAASDNGAKKWALKKKKYPCPVCRTNCPTSYARNQHVDNHFGKHLTSCRYCGKLFLHKQQYFLHHLNHSTKRKTVKNVPQHSTDITLQTENTNDLIVDLQIVKIENCYACQFCSVTFTDKNALDLHYYCDHPNETLTNLKRNDVAHLKSFQCYICYKRFFSEVSLKRHFSRHNRNFECKICCRKFTLYGLKTHLNKHLGLEEPFACPICHKVYKTKMFLKAHLIKHHKNKKTVKTVYVKKIFQYKCHRCNKGFMDKDKFEIHSKRYIEVECKICSKTFYKPFLQKHLDTHVKSSLTCNICGRDFSTKSSLKRHLHLEQRKDSEDIVMKCQICLQHFFEKPSLSYHMRIRHNVIKVEKNDDIKCKICNEHFASKKLLYEHDIDYHSEIKCETCFETFSTKNNLRSHIRDTHTEDIKLVDRSFALKCDICQKTFTKNGEYRTHLKNHEVHTCKICNEKIGVMHVLVKHLDSHIGENKPFDCKICTIKFAYRKDLHRHLIAEHKRVKDKLFECDICSLNYHHKTFLTKHISKSHIPDYTNVDADASSVPTFLYNCQTCQRGFNNAEKYGRHVKVHEYCETCVHCNVSYDNPTDFRSHFAEHANKLPLICTICSKLYTHKDKFRCHLLAEHRRLTKKALFTCEICSKGFHRQSSLDSHINIVHLSKPDIKLDPVFKCPVCQKPFFDQITFHAHFKRHGFFESCKICYKEFTVRTHLFKHLEDHLGSAPYSCVICKRTFTSRRSLLDHLGDEQSKNSHNIVIKCEICGYHYFHKMQYNKHIKYEHIVKNEPESAMPEYGHFMACLDLKKND